MGSKKKSSTKKPGKPAASRAKPGGAASRKAEAPAAPGQPIKRKLGLRGAAPWAARHAAKHAAEARARAAEPPLPGSARATIRTPATADDIKHKVAHLHHALAQIKQLRKNLQKNFYDIGLVLKDIREVKSYSAKGYSDFEAFLEREIDLGKTTSLRLVKIVHTFFKDAAVELGMDRVFAALIALEVPESLASTRELSAAKLPPAPISTMSLPLKPPGR
jgi:hypothetical protein